MSGEELSVRKLLGAAVHGASGERVGEIQDLVIDTANGCVAYAVIAEARLGGLRKKLSTVPWRGLVADADTGMVALAGKASEQGAGESSREGRDIAERFRRPGVVQYGYPSQFGNRSQVDVPGQAAEQAAPAERPLDPGSRSRIEEEPQVPVTGPEAEVLEEAGDEGEVAENLGEDVAGGREDEAA